MRGDTPCKKKGEYFMDKEQIKKLIPDITEEQLAGLETLISEAVAKETEKSAGEIKNAELERLLKAAGAKNAETVKPLLDADKLVLTKEGLAGFEEEIARIKKEYGYLFDSDSKKPQFTAPSGRDAAVTPEEFSGMSYRKRLKLFAENPQLYKQLVG